MLSIVPIVVALRMTSANDRNRKFRRYSFDSSGRCLGYGDVSARGVYLRRWLAIGAAFAVGALLIYGGVSMLRDNNRIPSPKAAPIPTLQAPL